MLGGISERMWAECDGCASKTLAAMDEQGIFYKSARYEWIFYGYKIHVVNVDSVPVILYISAAQKKLIMEDVKWDYNEWEKVVANLKGRVIPGLKSCLSDEEMKKHGILGV